MGMKTGLRIAKALRTLRDDSIGQLEIFKGDHGMHLISKTELILEINSWIKYYSEIEEGVTFEYSEENDGWVRKNEIAI